MKKLPSSKLDHHPCLRPLQELRVHQKQNLQLLVLLTVFLLRNLSSRRIITVAWAAHHSFNISFSWKFSDLGIMPGLAAVVQDFHMLSLVCLQLHFATAPHLEGLPNCCSQNCLHSHASHSSCPSINILHLRDVLLLSILNFSCKFRILSSSRLL